MPARAPDFGKPKSTAPPLLGASQFFVMAGFVLVGPPLAACLLRRSTRHVASDGPASNKNGDAPASVAPPPLQAGLARPRLFGCHRQHGFPPSREIASFFLSMTVDASALARHQSELVVRWHSIPPAVSAGAGEDFIRLLEENHLRNFQLWHEEDTARRDDLGFEAVYRAKRAIDRYNQERNNFIEAMDQAFVARLQPRASGCPRHSETPGMIVDRLSILALKDFHMHEETVRPEASPEHRAKCAEKLARIRVQRADLTACLAELFADIAAGRRTFSVYFQFKMYNDPALNPQLYRPSAQA
jgi:hypothetical protein